MKSHTYQRLLNRIKMLNRNDNDMKSHYKKGKTLEVLWNVIKQTNNQNFITDPI